MRVKGSAGSECFHLRFDTIHKALYRNNSVCKVMYYFVIISTLRFNISVLYHLTLHKYLLVTGTRDVAWQCKGPRFYQVLKIHFILRHFPNESRR